MVFSGANLAHANIRRTVFQQSGLTTLQLHSTASYRQEILQEWSWLART